VTACRSREPRVHVPEHHDGNKQTSLGANGRPRPELLGARRSVSGIGRAAVARFGQSVRVAAGKRPKRDSGSRTFLDVLLHPIAAVSAPSREGAPATDEDRRAASGPEGRLVTCFLRASFDPLPRRWKQGGLKLDQDGARWAPGFWPRGEGSPLPSQVQVQSVREVTGREGLHIKPGFFQVIEAATAPGDLRLAVPRDSVALVVERLTSGERE